ncbi:MAG: N-acetyl sugar amidotransferase [Phycisphaerae bacterium]|nr:N-acetyl sugar amidotransferase [Phycisphaerae bacterium]MDD5381530.1 N-acetyl sugar amidotransferase [Phycisphaerae bacterium]
MDKVCSRCILDDRIPGIIFDENGVCQYCKIHDELKRIYPLDNKGQENLDNLIKKARRKGKGEKYDCIIGVSGGTDSTYVLYQLVQLGIRPLAVHFDNGWDSDIAVRNIKNACSMLNVDLYTYVVEWEEFKDLQISFLRASTPDTEIPTDVGIHSILVKMAAKEGVKYVFNGHSFRAEGLMPIGWTYMDGKYIDYVHKKFGSVKLKTFPNFKLMDVLYYNIILGIKVIPILNYFKYEKAKIKPFLQKELGWQDYGGHHHESVYTKFYQSYLLPKKFNIDKRIVDYSAMIREGITDRETAIKEIERNPHHVKTEIVDYVISKLGLTKEEFNNIMNLPVKSFNDYPNYYKIIKFFKIPIKISVKLGLIPKLLYLKYLENE